VIDIKDRHPYKESINKNQYTVTDFPMEIFPLMGENYIGHPEIGRNAHLKRVRFGKYLRETKSEEFKNILFQFFAEAGVGRDMHIIATIEQ